MTNIRERSPYYHTRIGGKIFTKEYTSFIKMPYESSRMIPKYLHEDLDESDFRWSRDFFETQKDIRTNFSNSMLTIFPCMMP